MESMGIYFVDSKNIGGYEIFVSAGTWRCSGYASHCRSREPFLRLNAASRRLKKSCGAQIAHRSYGWDGWIRTSG